MSELKWEQQNIPKERGTKYPCCWWPQINASGQRTGTEAISLKSHLDNSSPFGCSTKGSFDLLASIPAGKRIRGYFWRREAWGNLIGWMGCAGCSLRQGQKGRLEHQWRERNTCLLSQYMNGGLCGFSGLVLKDTSVKRLSQSFQS